MDTAAQSESQAAVDPTDMDEVFNQYVERVYQFLYARVGNREDAEDLTSDVFLKASHQLDLQRHRASISNWLFTVARTVLADHWRRYYRFGAVAPLDDHPGLTAPRDSDPDDSTDETEKYVQQILSALPDRYRTVLEHRFLSGMTIRETAEQMGVTPDNAKVIQHRALAYAVARFNGPDEDLPDTIRAARLEHVAEPAEVKP